MGQVGQVGDDSGSPAVYLPFSSQSPLASCVFSLVPRAIAHTRCVTAELYPEQMALSQPSQQQILSNCILHLCIMLTNRNSSWQMRYIMIPLGKSEHSGIISEEVCV
jgi:hypothetical protein